MENNLYIPEGFEHAPSEDIYDNDTEIIIKKTNDYGQFKKLPGNRAKKAHWKQIMDSMLEKQIPVPVVVNELNQVIDGGHRVEACIEGNLPIYYIVIPGLRLEDVIRLNHDQVKWNNQDYVNSHAITGIREFVTIKRFQAEYTNLGLWHICAILTETYRRVGGSDFKEAIQSGRFNIIADLEDANSIAASLNIAAGKFKEERTSKDDVIFSMLKMISLDQFDDDIFFEGLNGSFIRFARKLRLTDGFSNVLNIFRQEWNRIIRNMEGFEPMSTRDLAR